MDEQNTTPPTEAEPVELAVVRFPEVPNCELHVPLGIPMQQVGAILAQMIYAHAVMGWNERDQYAQMAKDLKDEREALVAYQYEGPDPSHD